MSLFTGADNLSVKKLFFLFKITTQRSLATNRVWDGGVDVKDVCCHTKWKQQRLIPLLWLKLWTACSAVRASSCLLSLSLIGWFTTHAQFGMLMYGFYLRFCFFYVYFLSVFLGGLRGCSF